MKWAATIWFKKRTSGDWELSVLGRPVPLVPEETVLDQKSQNEVDEAFHCHESNIFPHKVPSERVHWVLLTWKRRQSAQPFPVCSGSTKETAQLFQFWHPTGCANVLFRHCEYSAETVWRIKDNSRHVLNLQSLFLLTKLMCGFVGSLWQHIKDESELTVDTAV